MTFHKLPFCYPETDTLKPRIAISACLAGEVVRYDGASKPLVDSDFFEQHFQLIPICPEVGAGLQVPRPPVQLVQTRQGVRAKGRDDPSIDVTDVLLAYREISLKKLSKEAICGYIFKSRSPSCGLTSTPIFNEDGVQTGLGSGIQASYFQQQMPWLVLREETQLDDIDVRLHFLWLCKISSECQQAIERKQLPSFHRHYQTALPGKPSISMTSKEYRAQLIEALDSHS
jgi:uncharacterized protein YbbK (DUF523 family)